jgi:hypothetical protein
MLFSVVGILIGVLGLAWTVYGVWSSNRLKKALITEKNLIKDKVLDLRASMEKHRQIILNDRSSKSEPRLNQVPIRIEEIESILDILDRFKNRLEELK